MKRKSTSGSDGKISKRLERLIDKVGIEDEKKLYGLSFPSKLFSQFFIYSQQSKFIFLFSHKMKKALPNDKLFDKSKLIERCCKLSVEIISMISLLLKNTPKIDSQSDIIELLDVKVNPLLEETKQYTQLGLWKKIQRKNKKDLKYLRDLISEKQKTENRKKEIEMIEKEEPINLSFKKVYLGQVMDVFKNDLDMLRKNEKGLDNEKISILMNFLENGVNIFDDLEKKVHLDKNTVSIHANQQRD